MNVEAARIAPLEPPYPPAVDEALRRWMPPGAAVEPLRLFRTLVRHAAMSDRLRSLGGALLRGGVLPARARELLILRTAARCGAEYEWGVHVAAYADAVGLDAATVRATATRSPEQVARDAETEGGDAALLALADELHDGAAIGDATFARLAATYDDAAILEAITVCGFYHLIAFVVNGARVEREPWAATFPADRP